MEAGTHVALSTARRRMMAKLRKTKQRIWRQGCRLLTFVAFLGCGFTQSGCYDETQWSALADVVNALVGVVGLGIALATVVLAFNGFIDWKRQLSYQRNSASARRVMISARRIADRTRAAGVIAPYLQALADTVKMTGNDLDRSAPSLGEPKRTSAVRLKRLRLLSRKLEADVLEYVAIHDRSAEAAKVESECGGLLSTASRAIGRLEGLEASLASTRITESQLRWHEKELRELSSQAVVSELESRVDAVRQALLSYLLP